MINPLVLLSFLVGLVLITPFILTLASRLYKNNQGEDQNTGVLDFGIIITAYRNAQISEPLIDSILSQGYPSYHIYLIADHCHDNPIVKQHQNLTIFTPSPALNLKIRSIRYAFDRLIRNHHYILVFDADNLAHPDLLSEFNSHLENPKVAVQGKRIAKNLDTLYARLDAAGEYYKNFTDRYVPWSLGSSAVLSGSGLIIEKTLFHSFLHSKEISQGHLKERKMMQEDKILQNYILKNGHRIHFCTKAIVYDEKIQESKAAITQRSRWMYSYFQNILNSLGHIFYGFSRLNWNRFLFGIITVLPPLIIQVGLALLLTFIWFWFNPFMSWFLICCLGIFSINFVWSLYLAGAPHVVVKSLYGLPSFMWAQVKALLKMNNPEKNFTPTVHTHSMKVDQINIKRSTPKSK